MKRVFLAVSFQKVELLNVYINELRSKLKAENIKWIDAKNAHLTLKYFGPTEDIAIKSIHLILKKAFENQKSFEIALSRLGIFGSKYQPRVLWIGLDDSSKIVALNNEVNHRLEEIDIYTDSQNFVPHLTIGRIKKLTSKKYFQSVVDRHQQFYIGGIRVDKVYLYQSILSKQGPVYKVLETYNLKD